MFHDEVTEKKKQRAFKLMIMVSICICALCVYGTYAVAMASKPKTVVLDLSKFSGRIFREGEIKPGTFTVDAPLEEAVRWGSDAILSYGQNGVKIWRPDHATMGVFQYSLIGNASAGTGGYSYNAHVDGKRLIVESSPAGVSLFLVVLIGLMSLVMSIIIGSGIVNQKYS